MTTVARRDPADKAKIDAIEKKLLANPEIAKLIDDLGTATTDANEVPRGLFLGICLVFNFSRAALFFQDFDSTSASVRQLKELSQSPVLG